VVGADVDLDDDRPRAAAVVNNVDDRRTVGSRRYCRIEHQLAGRRWLLTRWSGHAAAATRPAAVGRSMNDAAAIAARSPTAAAAASLAHYVYSACDGCAPCVCNVGGRDASLYTYTPRSLYVDRHVRRRNTQRQQSRTHGCSASAALNT